MSRLRQLGEHGPGLRVATSRLVEHGAQHPRDEGRGHAVADDVAQREGQARVAVGEAM